jgi:hypothetical protein
MQHPDEGTIHAWLDGELAPDDAQRVEEHVASCERCSTLVAEARGLIAASSRILTALDDVPAGVIPVREGEPVPARDDLAAVRAKKAVAELSRRRRWWRNPRTIAAAAMAFVAVGTLAVMQQQSTRSPSVISFERAADSAPLAAPPPAPVPSAASAEQAAASRADAPPPSAARGGSAGSRDGQAKQESAARQASAREPAGKTRDLSAPRERVGEEQLRLRESEKRSAAPVASVGAAANAAQIPPVQLQQAPRQQTVQQTPPPAATPPARLMAADSAAQVAARPRRELDSTARLALEAVIVQKALSAPQLSGCYLITAVGGARGAALPRAIALDSAAAMVTGDTTWYRARSLDVPPVADVTFLWRPARSPVEGGMSSVEIAVRRGQLGAESVVVTIERLMDVVVTGAAASARVADARNLAPRPAAAAYTARQTICPPR